MLNRFPSFDPPRLSGLQVERDGQPTGWLIRMSIRSLLLLQTIVAMIMLVFIGHWGWGTFLVTLLATFGSAFATLRSPGRRRSVGFLATISLVAILYLLSFGPFQGIGRIFNVATRVQIHHALGWVYQPLDRVGWCQQTSNGPPGKQAVEDKLGSAYQRYLRSFH